jgi:hypothetical protein
VCPNAGSKEAGAAGGRPVVAPQIQGLLMGSCEKRFTPLHGLKQACYQFTTASVSVGQSDAEQQKEGHFTSRASVQNHWLARSHMLRFLFLFRINRPLRYTLAG